jgi:hypothetical protein
MDTQAETNSREISSYEDYLSTFLPSLEQIKNDILLTPEEIGVKMAEETLKHIQNKLTENNKI